MAANSAKSGSLLTPTFAGFGILNGKARTVSCTGEPLFTHRRKVDSMAGRHSAKRILARLFRRYAPEMRTEKTFSAAPQNEEEGAWRVPPMPYKQAMSVFVLTERVVRFDVFLKYSAAFVR